MRNFRIGLVVFLASTMVAGAQTNAEVKVLGEMRRMFTEHDIGPHVDLAEVVDKLARAH